jgi:3-methyladenine DNA glycosylase Tag
MKDHRRCAWAEGDPQMRAYHDEEWGVPHATLSRPSDPAIV